MQIEKITVGELPTYIESVGFKGSEAIPITQLRAISQSRNPRASADDIALLVARSDKGDLLSFIGLMPDTLFEDNLPRKMWSNSCWWSHPAIKENGSMQLFFLACKLTQNRLFFPELTPHTTLLVEKMKGFSVLKLNHGFRGYLYLNLATLLPSCRSTFSKIRPLLQAFDLFVNLAYRPVLWYWENQFSRENIDFEIVKSIDAEVDIFISEMNKNEAFRRSQPELNWVLANPWVAKDVLPINQRYAFTSIAKEFENLPVAVKSNQKIVAFFILLIRDGNAQLTYFYCETAHMKLATDAIFQLLLQRKIFTFTAFNSRLTDYIFSSRNPFLLIRKQVKSVGYSKEYQHAISAEKLQHGDGDCSFV